MNRIFGLDLMRTVAILFVLLGHGWFLLGDIGEFALYIKNILVFGVEIFFVLSGFLIGGILLRDFEKSFTAHDVLHFWKRRWFRTMPNYLLFIVINFIGFSMLSTGFDWNWQYLFFFQNFAWMPDGFFSVSWSLAIEEWFYLILPLAIFSLKFIPLKYSSLIVIFIIITAGTLLRLHGAVSNGYQWNEELRLVTIYRLDSLMYGVLAAWISHYKKLFFLTYAKQALIIAIGCISLAIYLRNSGLVIDHAIAAALFFPISCLGFMCTLPLLSSWRLPAEKKIVITVTAISTWSYSLYLIHVPILEFVKILAHKIPSIYNFPLNIIILCSWMTVSIIASYIIFNFFEKPIMNLREGSWFTKSPLLKKIKQQKVSYK